MPSYKFGDQDNLEFKLLPEGNYQFEVTKVATGIQNGGKTNGSDIVDIDFKLFDETGELVGTNNERLIMHERTAWRVDTFLKSANFLVDGRPLQKDDAVDLCEDTLIGLRGWCFVVQEPYTKKNGEEMTINRVKQWITNKDKLARNMPPVQASIQEEDIPF